MERLPLTRASQLIQIASALEGCGHSAQRLLSRCGWPDWYLEQRDVLIPTRHIWQYIERAARTVGDPAFGHRVGGGDPVGALGSQYANKLLSSATIYHELRSLCAHLNLQTSNMNAWLEDGGNGHIWLCVKAIVDDVGLAEMEQCNVMQLVQVVRLGAGPSWTPPRVRLQVGRIPGVVESALLADAVISHHQPCTAIAVPRGVLAWRLHGEARARASRRATDPAPPSIRDLVGAIGLLLRGSLPHGGLRIETAAEAAGIEVRTLQRRLVQNGTSFKEVVDRARFEAAIRQLDDGDAKIADIAFDVGYTDPAHFTRAFRRWAGVTPRAYRKGRLAA